MKLLGRLFIVVLACAPAAWASTLPSADELVDRSIAYHDPQGVWLSHPLSFIAEVRLDERLARERGYESRVDRFTIDNGTGRFTYHSTRGAARIEIDGVGDDLYARLDGTSSFSDEERDRYGLAPARLARLRNYFVYMYGLPMKLRDPGTRLDPGVKRTKLAGREVLSLRVTYDADVGGDTWYFYFDPASYALVGCRFYHVEADNDGEYLIFEDEARGPGGLRLPKIRYWHMNVDGERIAVDEIRSIR